MSRNRVYPGRGKDGNLPPDDGKPKQNTNNERMVQIMARFDRYVEKPELLVGSIVEVGNICCKIHHVYFAEYWDNEGWYMEFYDELGIYRNWKQWVDGGTITIPNRYVNMQGSDCSDIFRKYGYIK